jgi:hypothetical protein
MMRTTVLDSPISVSGGFDSAAISSGFSERCNHRLIINGTYPAIAATGIESDFGFNPTSTLPHLLTR